MQNRFMRSRIERFVKCNTLVGRHYQKLKAHRHRRRGEAELRLLPFLVPPDRTALDVGANKGIYTSVLAELAPRVVAFEPNPLIFQALRRVFPDNVEFLNLALSDAGGESDLVVARKRDGSLAHVGGSLRGDKAVGDFERYRVPVARLDDLGIDEVGFIKIDVEGFEAQVLDGARETIRRDRPTLLIELEEQHRHRPIDGLIAEVEALGYLALFLYRGRLQALAVFDRARHHDLSTADYVRNFIFLPVAGG